MYKLCYLFSFLFATCAYAQKKDIYATLDISSSMKKGDKYSVSNYALQLLSLLNTDNDFYFFINGKVQKVVTQQDYINLQKDIVAIKSGEDEKTEIEDIKAFITAFKGNSNKKYLLIIGDGEWVGTKELLATDSFQQIIKKNNFEAFFLHSGTPFSKSVFGQSIEQIPNFKVYKENNDVKSIILSCNDIMERISGISPLKNYTTANNNSEIEFKNIIPMKRILLVYQGGETVQNLLNLIKATQNNKDLKVQLIGTPSSEKFYNKIFANCLISSKVYSIEMQSLDANTDLKLNFSGPINKDNLRLFAVAEIDEMEVAIIADGKTTKFQKSLVSICRSNQSATIGLKYVVNNQPIDAVAAAAIKAQIVIGTTKYDCKYTDGLISAIIPLQQSDNTDFYIETVLDGYFQKTSEKYTITKKTCIDTSKIRILPTKKLKGLTYSKLQKGECTIVTFSDSASRLVLNPAIFDLYLSNPDSTKFQQPSIKILDDHRVEICLKLKKDVCQCFISKKEITFQLYASPKMKYAEFGYQPARIPISAKINKEGFMAACYRELLILLGSWLLFLYLWLLAKKRRFKSGSVIVAHNPRRDLNNSFKIDYTEKPQFIRKTGLMSWLSRWFNPISRERRSINVKLDKEYAFTFFAAKAVGKVSIDNQTFKIYKNLQHRNYEHDQKESDLLSGEYITTIDTRNNALVYKLAYEQRENKVNDVNLFRFIIILICAALITFNIIFIPLILNNNF